MGVLDVNGVEVDDGGAGELSADVRALEEYERLAVAAEWHRRRLQEMARGERSVQGIAATTLHRLYRQWRREERSAEMRWELQVLTHSHTAEVRRKEQWIDNASRHAAQHKTQSATQHPQPPAPPPLPPLTCPSLPCVRVRLCVAQRVHLLCVERLVSLHRLHLQGVEVDFHAQSASLRLHFDSQLSQLRHAHGVALRELQLVISAVDAEEAERVNEAKQAHETEREEVRNKNLESINELRITLESRIEELERAFDDHHRFYKETTDSAASHFRQLKAEDAALSLSIFDKRRRVARLSASLQLWRQKLQLNEKEGREKNSAIAAHRTHLQLQCDALKQRMHTSRSRQHHRMLTLSQQAQLAIDLNRQRVQTAQHVLQLAHMARSYATERERVQPYPAAALHISHTPLLDATTRSPEERSSQDEQKAQLVVQLQAQQPLMLSGDSGGASAAAAPPASSLPSASVPVGCAVAPLSGFFSAYNKVALDVLAMEAEKGRLQRDNRALRRQLQSFLGRPGHHQRHHLTHQPSPHHQPQVEQRAPPPTGAGAAYSDAAADPRQRRSLSHQRPATTSAAAGRRSHRPAGAAADARDQRGEEARLSKSQHARHTQRTQRTRSTRTASAALHAARHRAEPMLRSRAVMPAYQYIPAPVCGWRCLCSAAPSARCCCSAGRRLRCLRFSPRTAAAAAASSLRSHLLRR